MIDILERKKKMAKAKKMAAVPQVESGAEMLTSQYEKVECAKGAFVREAVRFGAMLIEVEANVLPRQNINNTRQKGCTSGGQGLETWLSENCPAINYKTAMSYKSMAAKFSAMLGGGDVAVAALAENSGGKTAKDEVIDVPAEIVEKREALFDEVDSRRKLEQVYFEFMALENPGHGATGGKAGRPKAEKVDLPKLKKSEEAAAIWAGVMRVIDKSAVKDAIPLLDAKATEVCLDRVGELYRALKEHSKEF